MPSPPPPRDSAIAVDGIKRELPTTTTASANHSTSHLRRPRKRVRRSREKLGVADETNANASDRPRLFHPDSSSIPSLNLLQLPNDILQKILSFLPVERLCTASCVNCELHNLCNEELLWRNLFVRRWRQLPLDQEGRLSSAWSRARNLARMREEVAADGDGDSDLRSSERRSQSESGEEATASGDGSAETNAASSREERDRRVEVQTAEKSNSEGSTAEQQNKSKKRPLDEVTGLSQSAEREGGLSRQQNNKKRKRIAMSSWKTLYEQQDTKEKEELKASLLRSQRDVSIQGDFLVAHRARRLVDEIEREDEIGPEEMEPEMIARREAEADASGKKCAGECIFRKESGDIYVCEQCGAIHVCGANRCRMKLVTDEGHLVCPVSGQCFPGGSYLQEAEEEIVEEEGMGGWAFSLAKAFAYGYSSDREDIRDVILGKAR